MDRMLQLNSMLLSSEEILNVSKNPRVYIRAFESWRQIQRTQKEVNRAVNSNRGYYSQALTIDPGDLSPEEEVSFYRILLTWRWKEYSDSRQSAWMGLFAWLLIFTVCSISYGIAGFAGSIVLFIFLNSLLYFFTPVFLQRILNVLFNFKMTVLSDRFIGRILESNGRPALFEQEQLKKQEQAKINPKNIFTNHFSEKKKSGSIRERLASLTPSQFEKEVVDILKKYGYKGYVTGKVGDYGCDAILDDRNGKKIVVQIKQFCSGHSIGRPELQKLQGAMLHYLADKAMFVTLSNFTVQSEEYAHKHGIHIIDGDELVDMIRDSSDKAGLLPSPPID